MILLLTGLLLADDSPKYKTLKQGEIAPWDGRLLNDLAFKKIMADNYALNLECQASTEFELNKQEISHNFKYELLESKYNIDKEMYESLLKSKDEYIKKLEPQDNTLWAAGGFVIGAGITIGIVYALAPGVQQSQ